MSYTDYFNMPFEQLFQSVFTDTGQIKPCGRAACIEMIKRLDKYFNTSGKFGNINTGRLETYEAFIAAKEVLNTL